MMRSHTSLPLELKQKLHNFKYHHKQMIHTLRKQEYHKIDGFILVVGMKGSSLLSKSRALQYYYFGCEYQDFMMVVTRKKMLLLADDAVLIQVQQLEYLSYLADTPLMDLTFIKKSRSGNSSQIAYMFDQIREERRTERVEYGFLRNETSYGSLQEELEQYINSCERKVNRHDCSMLIGQVLCVLDQQQQQNAKLSSRMNAYCMKKVMGWVQYAIDRRHGVSHQQFSRRLEKMLQEETECKIMERQCSMDSGEHGLSYQCVVQSGGNYDVSFMAQSNGECVSADIVIISVGCHYQHQYVNCVRTLIFDPNQELRTIYNVLVNIQEYTMNTLKPGVKLSQVYEGARELWKQMMGNKYDTKFPECLGYAIGMEMREQYYTISPNCNHFIETDMCFFVQMYLEGIRFLPKYTVTTLLNNGGNSVSGINANTNNTNNHNKKLCTYTIMIGDTVLIVDDDNKGNEVVTLRSERAYKDISYSIVENVVQPQSKEFIRLQSNNHNNHHTNTNHTNGLQQNHLLVTQQFRATFNKSREHHQEQLKQKKQFEMEERILGKDWKQESKTIHIKMQDINSYKTHEQYHQACSKSGVTQCKFRLDEKAQSILIPCGNDQMMPLHILTVKNVRLEKQRNNWCLLKIWFWTTENSVASRLYPVMQRKEVFIKEVVLRSRDGERLLKVAQVIQVLQKESKKHFSMSKQNNDLRQYLEPEQLIITNKSTVCLNQIRIRPYVSACRFVEGVLECHSNGLRYFSNRIEQLDIPYNFIKFCFYQSPLTEVIGAIHFHLHAPIYLARKHVIDLQFFKEVRGGIEQQQQQQQNNNKEFDDCVYEERNEDENRFQRFLTVLQAFLLQYNIHYEEIQSKSNFEVTWSKARVTLKPTSKCLLNIVDIPFSVFEYDKFDIACLERVQPGLINFDLILVYKNHEKGVEKLQAIDKCNLELVETILDTNDVLYFISSISLIWKNMLFTINKDFQQFVHEGGWAKIMVNYHDHGPLALFQDDGSFIFEPDTSKQNTSFSSYIPSLEDSRNYDRDQAIYIEDSVSDIADSQDIFKDSDSLSDHHQLILKKKKKIKYNNIILI